MEKQEIDDAKEAPLTAITLTSRATEKARNQLFMASLFVIVYAIYKPTLSGIFDDFAIHFKVNAEYAFILFILAIIWMTTRYISLIYLDYTTTAVISAKHHWLVPFSNTSSLNHSVFEEIIENVNKYSSNLKDLQLNPEESPHFKNNIQKNTHEYIAVPLDVRLDLMQQVVNNYENSKNPAWKIDQLRKSFLTILYMMEKLFPVILSVIAIILLAYINTDFILLIPNK